jgi:hypothetical protein
MSPQMMRFFTLVGIALAAASLQLKARAETFAGTQTGQVHEVAIVAQPAALAAAT